MRIKLNSIKNPTENPIDKSNNFGLLRLLFAYLVILSHSPELLDGNAHRELLNRFTGTLTFGVFAVDGFFLISGYLICQSFVHSKTTASYFFKRILRIYPAFVVIWVVSLFIVVPLSGNSHLLASLDWQIWLRNLVKIAILSQPHIDGFAFNPHIEPLNGSMWTIRYEFLCYLTIPLIALIGLNKKNVILLTALILGLNLFTRISGVDFKINTPFPLSLHLFTRLGFAFLVGICFYQFKERIVWDKKISLACVLLVALFIQNQLFAELALISFGGYLMFNFAFNFKNAFTQSVGIKNDISYGVYLYAWPVQGLLIQHYPTINPWLLALVTIAMVSILGFLSWRLIEKPFLNFKHKI